MLSRFREVCPEIEVSPSVDSFEVLTDHLRSGRIDLCLTYDLGLDAGFSRTVLTRVVPHAFVATDHRLAGRASTTLRELAQFPLVLFYEGLSVQHMLRLFRGQGLLPEVTHRAASLEVMRSLAANGEGVGLSYTVPPGHQSYDGKALVSLPITDPDVSEPLILVAVGQGDMPEDMHRIADAIRTAPGFAAG